MCGGSNAEKTSHPGARSFACSPARPPAAPACGPRSDSVSPAEAILGALPQRLLPDACSAFPGTAFALRLAPPRPPAHSLPPSLPPIAKLPALSIARRGESWRSGGGGGSRGDRGGGGGGGGPERCVGPGAAEVAVERSPHAPPPSASPPLPAGMEKATVPAAAEGEGSPPAAAAVAAPPAAAEVGGGARSASSPRGMVRVCDLLLKKKPPQQPHHKAKRNRTCRPPSSSESSSDSDNSGGGGGGGGGGTSSNNSEEEEDDDDEEEEVSEARAWFHLEEGGRDREGPKVGGDLRWDRALGGLRSALGTRLSPAPFLCSARSREVWECGGG